MASFRQLYLNRRVAWMLPLGFASGLPLALTADTLFVWGKDAGMSLSEISMLSLVSLPYTLKFLWAALLDRYALPLLDRRRCWILAFQLLLMLAIAILGICSPGKSIWLLAAAAMAVSIFSASQDIAVDAYRTDILEESQRGSGAAVFVSGYRLGMIVSGGAALMLADHGFSWSQIYAAMSLAMVVGIIATIFAEPTPHHIPAPPTLQDALITPLRQLLIRRGGWLVLLFVVLFKLPDVAAGGLTSVFLMDIGVSKAEIAAVRQTLGLGITIVGALAGGAIVGWVGLRKSLWIFGILQALSNAGFLLLAHQTSRPLLLGVISVESLCGGLVTAGFSAFLMSQCDRRHSAFQFALLSGCMAITRVLAGPPSGPIAGYLGWSGFFWLTIAAAIPGMAMLPFLPLGAPEAPAGPDE